MTGSRNRLPTFLRGYFWDYAFNELSWDVDRDLIIRRVLSEGTWDAGTWLRKRIGDESVRQWLIAHQGRGLSPRQLSFWALILDIPDRQGSRLDSRCAGNPMESKMIYVCDKEGPAGKLCSSAYNATLQAWENNQPSIIDSTLM